MLYPLFFYTSRKALLITHFADIIQPFVDICLFVAWAFRFLIQNQLSRAGHKGVLVFYTGKKHAVVIRVDGYMQLRTGILFCAMDEMLIVKMIYGNETIKEEDWAPFVQSVVVFGRCHLVESGARAITLLKRFAMKYYPSEQLVDEEIAHAGKAVQIFEIEVEYLSGKEIQER